MSIWKFPAMPWQMATTALCFVTRAAIFAVGAHLSYTNVAHIKAQGDLLREHLCQKYGYENGKYTEGPRVKK